jgi:hypothetical protein
MFEAVYLLSIAPGAPWTEFWRLPLLLYFSPETILPVASVLASIVGVLLMFGRYFISMVRKALGRPSPATDQGPAEIEDIDLTVDGHVGPRSEEVPS